MHLPELGMWYLKSPIPFCMEVLYLYSLLKEKLIFQVVSELTQIFIRLTKMTLWDWKLDVTVFLKLLFQKVESNKG